MCKNLLVFSLAFLVGIIFIQVFKRSGELPRQKVVLTQNFPNKPALYPQINPIDDFFNNFKKAVAENDRATVILSINFPIRVVLYDGKKSLTKTIKNEAEFIANYDRIFDDTFKDLISQTEINKFAVSTGGDLFNVKSGILMKVFGVGDIMKIHQFTKLDIKITELKRK